MKLSKEDKEDYLDFGLILVYLVIGLFLFLTPKIVNENDLKEIYGTLSQEPFFGSIGGDVQNYFVKINLSSEPNDFVIKSCSYDELDKEKIRMLHIGDSVDILVNSAKKITDRANNDFEIYQLHSQNYGLILNIVDVNKCNSSSWIFGPIGMVLFGLFAIWKIGKRIIIIYNR